MTGEPELELGSGWDCVDLNMVLFRFSFVSTYNIW